MAQDPVLQREMFNPRDRSARSSGITSMVDDGSSGMTREERLQMAKDMLAEAQMKQSPEYYFKTLAQGDRPAMTRPVASSAPPPVMQQMPAAQQMAQMQAAGVRPVGMADGGIVRRGFFDGGLNTVSDIPTLPPLEPTIRNPEASAIVDTSTKLTDMSDDEIRELAVENARKLKSNVGGSEFYRKVQDLTRQSGTFTDDNISMPQKDIAAIPESELADIIQRDLQRTKSQQDVGITEEENAAETERLKKRAGIRSLFETLTPEEFEARQRAVKEVGAIDRTPGSDDTLYTDPTRREFARLQKADEARRAVRIPEDPTTQGKFSFPVDPNDRAAYQADKDKAIKDREAKGLASLRNMESGLDLGRGMADVEGDVPLIVNQGVAERAERKAIRIPEDPTLQGKATIPGVPGAAAARDAGAGAGGGAAAQEPAKYSATTTLESIKSERAKEREDNFNMALIQAGLAMMGGKSSNALANIGEGGMQGIKQFSEQEREATRGYREDVKGVREEERFARAEERAAAAAKEDSRRFELTYGEGIRQFDANARRQNRQLEITEDQFKKTFGQSVADAARNAKQFEQQFGLSVQAARQKISDTAQSFEFEAQKLAINREELLQRAEESKATTAQAIASRDAKKLESAAGLATQILNATQARIANLLGRQQENTRMGLDPDPAIAAEVQELKRQAEEAQSNFYALNESLGTKLPGSNVVEYGNLK